MEQGPIKRVLSIGCASGEEPYSIVMVARECRRNDLEIVGVDVVPENIEYAIQAVYPVTSSKSDLEKGDIEAFLSTIPIKFRDYFSPQEGKWKLADEVRNMVEFEVQDIRTMDIAGLQPDLIVCRYLLEHLDHTAEFELRKRFVESARVVLIDTDTVLSA